MHCVLGFYKLNLHIFKFLHKFTIQLNRVWKEYAGLFR